MYDLNFDYHEYLQDDWFRSLTDKLIYSNSNAKCWICNRRFYDIEKDEYLLLHHVSYENLYREKLGRDIYILCSSCHKKAHFYWFFGLRKIPLTKRNLIKRLRILKFNNCIQNRRFWASAWYGIRYIMS